MTASNGIRTEYKIKRLAAALALAVAAMLGSSCLSPARADAAGTSEGNLVIDVPTTVPCALMADGTVVSPSEWKITTSGGAYIASASASGFPANVEWSARTTDLAAGQAGSVQVSGTGDAASVSGPSDPVAAKLAPSAGFEWAFSKLDAGKNSDIVGKAAGGTAVLGSVTFTFAKVEPDAFAVYSADDNSLSFYKRAGVPVAGQTFEGKTATEVYTGIETMISIPGWTQNHFNDIKTVTVYDKGIAPTGTAFWFAGVRNLKTADVSKLDMSRCKTIECMFTDCISLETLDLSGWDTSSLTNMSQAFHHCASLTKLNVSGWDVSKVTNMQLAFAEDKALGSLDLSTWDNSATTTMKDAFLQMDSLNEISLGSKFKFVGTNGYLPVPSSTYIAGADGKWYDTDGNGYAPADIPSNKAMTYTAVAPKKAFAVYSADDDSLSFYKRTNAPSAGEQFEGKTATEVYEGVEKASYTAADGAPWSGHAADIASVTVEDAGVSPVSTAYWFKGASKLKSMSLAGLDTSQTTCMDGMFDGCSSLETLDLSAMSTRRVASMTAFLGGCDSLVELSIGSEFAWVGEDCYPPTGDWKQGSTGTDYSESDIPTNKTDKYTRTKTAFAVYSADDHSLTFYKRPAVPAEGAQFLGKTATKVFTSFETQQFDGYLSNVPWLSYQSNVKTVTVADEGIAPVSTANWFYSFTNVESINLSKLDTRNVTSMYCMFRGCKTLTTLDVSSFSTANVTNMGSMFDGCSALTSLDLSSFDTGNVWKTASMFCNCKALTTLDVSSFDTANVKYMGCMFCNCKALTSLDVSSFDTGSVTDMDSMFDGCSALTSLDLSAFDTTNVTNMRSMFFDCEALTALGVSSFATEKVTNMYGMFYNCGSLTSLDVSSFDTGKVTDMGSMFYGCKTLTTLDVSSFSTANVTNMYGMFCNCGSLTSLDVSSFDTGKVTKMGSMFYGCKALAALDVSSFNTSKVMDMGGMFYGCAALPALDVLSFDTGKVTDMGSMFYGCKALTTLDVSSFSTANVTDMSWMFNECKALTALDLSSFSTENVTNMGYMFRLCPKLQKVTFGADWKWVGTSGYLPTPSSTYIAGVDGKWYDADGNGYAPKDIPSSKAMTYTAIAPEKAFAVYSADDQSLTFYKRVNVPSAGEQFESKTVTAVYTGIETDGFTPKWTTEHGSDLESVTVADEAIAPKSTASWFKECRSIVTSDVAKLDMSKCKDISYMFSGCDRLMSLDLSAWDTSSFENISFMLESCRSLREVNVNGWDVSNVVNMEGAFYLCANIRTLDISSWDNSKTKNMKRTFWNMHYLEKVKLGDNFQWVGDDPYLPDPSDDWIDGADGWWHAQSDSRSYAPSEVPERKADTYVVTPLKTAFAVYSADDQSLMFYKRLDVPKQGESYLGKTATSVYTGIEIMVGTPEWTIEHGSTLKSATIVDEGIAPVSTSHWFSNTTALKSANMQKLDTHYIKSMTDMFFGCKSLTSLDLSSFDTRNVTSMSGMFNGCKSLTSLDLSSFDTRNVTDMSGMFNGCKSLTTLNLSSFDTGRVTSMSGMFNGCESLTALGLSSFDTGSVTDMYGMFNGCGSLTSLDVSSFDTGSVTSMTSMFDGCKALTSLDLSSFDTGNVSGMLFMFLGCSALTSLDLSSFNTQNVTEMASMFSGCNALTSLDVSKLDTRNVTNMSGMFNGCKSLTTLNLSSFDTGRVTSMRSMFDGCDALTSLNLSSFDTSNVKNMYGMFNGCDALTSLNLSSFDTRNVTNMYCMFNGCKALTSLDLSTFDMRNVTNMDYFFSVCVSLERISLGTGFKWVGQVCYPRTGNWESASTGMIYTEKKIPGGIADTYVFKPNTKASTAVNAASDPANNDATIAAMTSTGNTQGESAIQEATEGKPTLEKKTSKESGMTTEPDGVEKDAEGKPAVENEATKEDVSATEPEGDEKTVAVKSGE